MRAEAGRAGGKAKGPMNNLELERTWADLTERVKSYPGVSAPQVDAFFMRLHPQAASEGFLMLTADNDFIKKHIEQNFLEHITRAMEEWSGVASTVLIEVDEPSAAPSAPAQQASDTPAVSPAAGPQPTGGRHRRRAGVEGPGRTGGQSTRNRCGSRSGSTRRSRGKCGTCKHPTRENGGYPRKAGTRRRHHGKHVL